MTPPQRRRLLVIAAANLAGVALLLGLLEALARVAAPGPAEPLFDAPGLHVRDRPFVREHPSRGFALRPGFRDATYGINAAGLRGPELPESLAVRRVVLALGDSTTFGWGVADDETWPHHVGRRLLQSGREDALVLNAGVPSYTSPQLRLYLEELLPRFQPQLVLVGAMWNDVWYSSLDPWYPEALILRRPPTWRRLANQSSALFRWIASRGGGRGQRDFLNPRALAYYGENLDAMVRAAREQGASIAFVMPPFDVSHVRRDGGRPLGQGFFSRDFVVELGRRYTAALAEVAQRHGVPVIDHRVSIRRPRQPRLFQDAIHPRPRGNRLMGEDIARSLVERRLLEDAPAVPDS